MGPGALRRVGPSAQRRARAGTAGKKTSIKSDTRHVAASGQDAPEHAARYEALRAYAVERHALPSRDGLVLLLRQGVAAWMEAWSRLPAPAPPPAQAERQRSSPLPDDVSAEVVRVLTAMTLAHIHEVHV